MVLLRFKRMKSVVLNIKNLLPYLFLIGVYFFFVNIEARNAKNINQIIKKEKASEETKSKINYDNKIISIPVIPYEP